LATTHASPLFFGGGDGGAPSSLFPLSSVPCTTHPQPCLLNGPTANRLTHAPSLWRLRIDPKHLKNPPKPWLFCIFPSPATHRGERWPGPLLGACYSCTRGSSPASPSNASLAPASLAAPPARQQRASLPLWAPNPFRFPCEEEGSAGEGAGGQCGRLAGDCCVVCVAAVGVVGGGWECLQGK
jgi:hypothetical protein